MPPKKKPKPPRFFRHFDTTIPKLQTCRRCGCWLAAGIAEGSHVRADLVALDLVQQQIAVLGGMRLFALTRTGLIELDSYRLQDPKFDTRYAEHRCGVNWESRATPGQHPGLQPLPDEPPY